MAVTKVSINSVCNTSNDVVTLSNSSGNTQIQWNAAGKHTYTITVPANVFQEYPNGGSFDVTPTSGWTPTNPLTLLASPTLQTILNYISENGVSCTALGGGPQIVIGS
jgi:hypothetical protein